MAGRRWRRDREKERTWRRRLRDWRRSRLSVREFCDWHALSEPSFYAWRRELAQGGRKRCQEPLFCFFGRPRGRRVDSRESF